jgi:hypothetical protein
MAMLAGAGEGAAHPGNRDHRPVYQRRAFDWTHSQGNRHGRGHRGGHIWSPPRANEGWFQRPYPYHLDYYRMRYGGSYAPYFGNLYGPPQVVTAPPYYGPYYGGYGFQNGPAYDTDYTHLEQPPNTSGTDEAETGPQLQKELPAPSPQ